MFVNLLIFFLVVCSSGIYKCVVGEENFMDQGLTYEWETEKSPG